MSEIPKKYEFKMRRLVEFYETDLAGIVHYSNFFRYMESAEHAFFRSLGISVLMDKHMPPYGWPRVHTECDFKAPLKFEDEIEIRVLVAEMKIKTLTFLFRITKINGPGPIEVAVGKFVTVCVTLGDKGTFQSMPIPKSLTDMIEVAPPELLKVENRG